MFQLDLMDFKELITIHIWYIYDIVMYFQHKNEEENVLTPKTKPQFLFKFYHIHKEDRLHF